MIWTKPKQFEHTHVVTTPVINKYSQSNLRYLFERRRHQNRIVPSLVTDYQTASNDYVTISQNFRVVLDIENEDTDVLLWYNLHTIQSANATNYQSNHILVQQDGDNYLPIDDDSLQTSLNYTRYSASTVMTTSAKLLIRGLAIGRHYWDFLWKTNVVDSSLQLHPNILQVTGAIEL